MVDSSKAANLFVVLLKGTVDNDVEDTKDLDRYSKALSPISCMVVPVLKFEPVASEVERIEQHPFESVLVTSPRGVWALMEAYPKGSLLQRLSAVPWYVVGEASREAVRNKLSIDHCFGSETGSAEKFIEQVRAGLLHPKRVAYLCSNLRRSVMGDGLRDLGISFEEFEIYKTVPLNETSIPQPPDGMRRVCVFFSPSGVAAVSHQLRTSDIVIAIGATTAQALKDTSVKIDSIAPTPSPEGLISALGSVNYDENRT